ncbi:hypothetical protein GCM10027214_13420 [Stenotrophomonas tumulicola]
MVVASELATGAHGGASSLIDQRSLLPAPAVLAVALALALCAGNASASETNQTLRDLQALAAKYTQQAPLKVDAEVALAAIASQQAARPLADVDANVRLRLASDVPAVRRAVPVAVKVDAGVRAQVAAPPAVRSSAASAAAASVSAGLATAVSLDRTAAATADVKVAAALDATVAPASTALDAQVAAQASARLAAKEEEIAATDAVVSAALDSDVAGGVGVAGEANALAAADRNPKLATQAQATAQASSLGLGSIIGGVGSLLDGVGDAVGGLVQGDLGAVVGGVGSGLGGLVGGVTDGLGLTSPSAIPPDSPKAPRPADPNSGLIIGSGGLVGTLSTLVGPTVQDLLGGDGYVRNGNLAVSNANVMQTYSVTNVLGIPLVNLSPVGTLLNGLGGATTGGSSHLTLIGGVTSDSYIYNINNGDPNGLLGLLLPGQAPDWAAKCLNVLGVVSIDCWAVNPAQDYQVLMGDGAYANGSREVVIGANASHRLPLQDANEAFPGAGVNDPTDPTGVPTADYAARLGHSVIVGDSASGTANGQVLLGAEATSDKANSVALGFRSSALRGAQASYNAYGLNTAQTSSGEVSVGFAGGERQITNVAAGSQATDAVNVSQLQGAINQIEAVGTLAVTYDDDGTGAPNYRRVTLGGGTGNTTLANVADGVDANDAVNVGQLQASEQGALRYDTAAGGGIDYSSATLGDGATATTLRNVGAGAVSATSNEAVNGAQLFGSSQSVATHLGGGAGVDGTGVVTAPTYSISNVGADGSVSSGDYNDVGTAFDAVDGSLVNLNTQITDINNGAASRYFKVNSSGADAVATGAEAVAIGADASATAANAVALGNGSVADRDDSVSVGAAGAERQLTNVAAATEATDAVNLEQLQASEQGALRYDTEADGSIDYSSATLGDGATATTLRNVGAGEVSATSNEAINGAQLFATSQSVATHLGGGAGVDGTGAVTAPTYSISSVGVDGAVNSGDYNDVGTAFDAVDGSLVNLNTQISNINNGAASRFFKVNSTGADAAAGGNEAVAIGAGANASADNAVALGSGSIADRADSVSVGAAGAERQLTNVAAATEATDAVNLGQLQESAEGALRYDIAADGSIDYSSATLGDSSTATTLRNVGAGEVSATSNEAINGAQLFATSQSVATHLGGGAGVDGNGLVTAPTYTINSVAVDGSVSSGDYNDVGTAFDAVSDSLANVADKTDSVDRLAVKYDADGAGNASNAITLVGDGSGSAVLLDNVADGSVTAGSRQAVTGNQLFESNQTVANYFGGTTVYDGATNTWTAPTFRISSIATDGSVIGNDYSNVTVAFSAVDSSLLSLNQRIDNIGPGGSPYLAVNSSKAAAVATGSDAVAVGGEASASGNASVAVGDGANATADNSVALGAGSVADTGAQSGYTGAYGEAGASNSAGEVSVGSTGGERKVTHVADGSDRYDAVNVGQLQNGVEHAISESKNYTDQQITNINNGTSGMFQVNDSQSLGNPSASGDNSVAGGAGAAAAGANATALGNGSQAQADNSVALGAGSVANRANTVSVGSAGAERQIANVADGSEDTDAVNVRQLQASQQGTLRYDSNTNGTTNYNSVTLGQAGSGPTQVRNVAAGTAGTDAVNVNQLQAGMSQTLDWSKAYTDQRIDSFDRNLRKVDNRASAGVASAMAVASLPQPSEAGRSMASFAAGSFNGESGMALGISGVSEGGRWIYKFSGSTNTRGDGGVAVGAGIQW